MLSELGGSKGMELILLGRVKRRPSIEVVWVLYLLRPRYYYTTRSDVILLI